MLFFYVVWRTRGSLSSPDTSLRTIDGTECVSHTTPDFIVHNWWHRVWASHHPWPLMEHPRLYCTQLMAQSVPSTTPDFIAHNWWHRVWVSHHPWPLLERSRLYCTQFMAQSVRNHTTPHHPERKLVSVLEVKNRAIR